jgi:hypothetical protein
MFVIKERLYAHPVHNFVQETFNARDDTVFHLQFFESQDLNLILRLLRVTVDGIRKGRSVLCFYMFAYACVRACVLKDRTVIQHFSGYVLLCLR